MLCVSRLSDPQKTAGHENLAVGLLPQLPEVRADQVFLSEMKQLVDAAVQSAEPCRQYRNKRISHFDLDAHMQAQHSFPVKRASMLEVRAALVGI